MIIVNFKKTYICERRKIRRESLRSDVGISSLVVVGLRNLN